MPDKKKVFHVITKLELGGAQKVTLMTLERLPLERYELALVTGSEGLLIGEAVEIPGVRTVQVASLVREIRPIQDLGALWCLYRLFRRERPDFVHTHSSKAGILGRWAAWLAGVPYIFHTAHGFGFNRYQGAIIRTLYIWIERLTRRITTRLVFVSHSNVRTAESYNLIGNTPWILCRDAISVREFLDSDKRERKSAEWGIPPGRTLVGMVACFKPQKAPLDFVDVAAKVLESQSDVHFVMVGDGDLRPAIESRIRERGVGDNMTLLGWRKDMPDVYASLGIVVLTSLWEGLPCVFSEAMASSRPLVVTDADGAREAITDGENGYIHAPRDVDALARSVVKLVNDRELRVAMGRRGRARVAQFDIATAVATLESEYRECLADTSAGNVAGAGSLGEA